MFKFRFFMVMLLLLLGFTAAKAAIAVEKQADLIEKAKKEGELVIYGSTSQPDQEKMLNAFKKIYPFIKVFGLRMPIEEWSDRVVKEKATRGQLADVGWGHMLGIVPNIKEGLVERYTSPERATYPDRYKDKDGLWTANTLSYVTSAYNTNLVKDKDIPKTWDDLYKPVFKGKTCVDNESVEMMMVMTDAWGKEKTMAYWKKVAANNPTLVAGANARIQGVTSGEYALGIGIWDQIVWKDMQAGAPINYVSTLDPVPVVLHGIFLYKNAPHPNVAKLFIDWMLSVEAQKMINIESGRYPARPGTGGPPRIAPGVKEAIITASDAARESEMLRTFQQIMGVKRIGDTK